MAEEEEQAKTGGMVKDTIEAATGLVKAVPIYDDAIQPVAKEVGKGLATMGKLVNVALMPVTMLVWGADQLKGFFEEKVAKKLENTPPENIITPDPHVVGPAMESLRYVGQNEVLADLYANLIANAMDSATVQKAHPGFVEIIKNMTSDEALILNSFRQLVARPLIDIRIKTNPDSPGDLIGYRNVSAIGHESKVKNLELVPTYLDNLCRLGLLEIPPDKHLMDESAYDAVLESVEYKAATLVFKTAGLTITDEKKCISLTSLGLQFKRACIVDKAQTDPPSSEQSQ